MSQLTMVRDGEHGHKVLFDRELIGRVDRLSATKYRVQVDVGNTAGVEFFDSFASCLASFTMRNWRSVVGMSSLRTLPPKKYEPKRPVLTKKRWSYI